MGLEVLACYDRELGRRQIDLDSLAAVEFSIALAVAQRSWLL